MKVKKIVTTKNSKYPKRVKMEDGTKIRIPQQKKFNSFCQSHGCSIAAVNIGLQYLGVKRGLNRIYNWCKKNISGYTGSKLTIYGTMLAINGISGTKKAKWYPVTSASVKNPDADIKRIRKALKAGGCVLMEQKNPIHTNVVIATRKGGVYIATNGTVKQTSIKKLMNQALTGEKSESQQQKWFKSSKYGAGYVIIQP